MTGGTAPSQHPLHGFNRAVCVEFAYNCTGSSRPSDFYRLAKGCRLVGQLTTVNCHWYICEWYNLSRLDGNKIGYWSIIVNGFLIISGDIVNWNTLLCTVKQYNKISQEIHFVSESSVEGGVRFDQISKRGDVYLSITIFLTWKQPNFPCHHQRLK